MEQVKPNAEEPAGRPQSSRVLWLALAVVLVGVASYFLTLPYHQWRAAVLFVAPALCLAFAWKRPPLLPRR